MTRFDFLVRGMANPRWTTPAVGGGGELLDVVMAWGVCTTIFFLWRRGTMGGGDDGRLQDQGEQDAT